MSLLLEILDMQPREFKKIDNERYVFMIDDVEYGVHFSFFVLALEKRDLNAVNVSFGPLKIPKKFRNEHDLSLDLTAAEVQFKVFSTVSQIIIASNIATKNDIVILLSSDANAKKRGLVYSTLVNIARRKAKLKHKTVILSMKHNTLVCILRNDLESDEIAELTTTFELEKIRPSGRLDIIET